MHKKQDLIKFLLQKNVLSFGDFITKSGRKSPYFFNMGKINTAYSLKKIASAYADLIINHFGDKVDNVFGPSYKGIPLSIMVAQLLSKSLQKDISFTFDRKEQKKHGEGGSLIGHEYKGTENVVIVEDVLTSGLSLSHTTSLLESYNIYPLGAIVAVDRKEHPKQHLIDQKNIRHHFRFPIYELLSVNDILTHALQSHKENEIIGKDPNTIKKIKDYLSSFSSTSTISLD